MALKTFVKLNNIASLTDARYGAGMYVDLLGFNLDYSSEKYTSPELFKEITGWVSGVEFVGEFSHRSEPNILEILKDYPSITWIEYDRIEELKSLVGQSYNLVYKMTLGQAIHLEHEVSEILGESGIFLHIICDHESLTVGDLEVIKKLGAHCKVLLGSGVTAENVLDLIENAGIFGVSLSGGEETKPGLLDLNDLADILEKLEVED